MKCEDCKHWFDNGTNLSSCDRDALLRERDFFCAAWERKKPFERPDTNADRIRQMSDEELADLFLEWVACDDCPVIKSKCKREWANCKSAALAWLKAPVEEVDNG